MKFLAVWVGFLICGCVTVVKTPIRDTDTLTEAIDKNDSQTVIKMLSSNSFVTKESTIMEKFAGAEYGSKQLDERLKSKKDAYDLFDMAISNRKTDGKWLSVAACRVEIVEAFLGANLPPRPEDLANAAASGCVNVTEKIFQKLPKDEKGEGISLFLNGNERLTIDLMDTDPVFVQSELVELKSLSPVNKMLLTKSGELCEDPDDKSKNCVAMAQFKKFDAGINKRIAAIENRQNTMQRNIAAIESEYKMHFCSTKMLGTVLYEPGINRQVETNCMYILTGPFSVLQVIQDGILVKNNSPASYAENKVFFVKTPQTFVDGDHINSMLVRASGMMKYTSLMGGEKTIHKFEWLGDIKAAP